MSDSKGTYQIFFVTNGKGGKDCMKIKRSESTSLEETGFW